MNTTAEQETKYMLEGKIMIPATPDGVAASNNININCYILEGGPVKIGNNVMIGPNVSLIGGTHSTDPKIRNACGGTAYGKPITIKDGAWIGCGAIILPGVTIGENAVVGSGSVVTHDVPDNMIAVGNPAKVRRRVSEHLGWTIENRDVPLD
ncbi:maltose o-acetyltransferase putative [Entamoeba histolytica]|uniref:Maltose o-acetyltransferase putative n=1 Tax=Entamoeba histolytica TaxID=5759 RepID=A0A175K0T1_ENTHI|nr:maltose o-acetyltransferase putative [Entamoeba histolytica]